MAKTETVISKPYIYVNGANCLKGEYEFKNIKDWSAKTDFF